MRGGNEDGAVGGRLPQKMDDSRTSQRVRGLICSTCFFFVVLISRASSCFVEYFTPTSRKNVFSGCRRRTMDGSRGLKLSPRAEEEEEESGCEGLTW